MKSRLNIIFYSIGSDIDSKSDSKGSAIRPRKIYDALLAQGHKITLIDGDIRKRKRQIALIKSAISHGEHYDFMYVENSNKPNTLTGRFPWLQNFFVDYSFFKLLHKHAVKIGVFYRDIYWRYDIYWAMLPFFIAVFAKPFYYWDLLTYKKYASHLFLPSNKMFNCFPPFFQKRHSELPPGTSNLGKISLRDKPKNLQILYVGGISKPLYDISEAISVIGSINDCSLTICCRESEWKEWSREYDIPNNVNVVHESGVGLHSLYDQHHLFLNFRKAHPYLDFCMPVKIFEAISFKLPIITNANNSVADLVEKYDIGWLIGNASQLSEIIECLVADRSESYKKYENLDFALKDNTWNIRASRIIEILAVDHRERAIATQK